MRYLNLLSLFLLKKQIGTELSDFDLGINGKAEEISQPKARIENAIRIAREGLRQRLRHKLSIAELYLPIGQQIPLERLAELPSYLKFRDSAVESLRALGLHD